MKCLPEVRIYPRISSTDWNKAKQKRQKDWCTSTTTAIQKQFENHVAEYEALEEKFLIDSKNCQRMCLGKPKSKLLVKIQIQIQFIDKDFEKGPKVISEVIKDKKRKKKVNTQLYERGNSYYFRRPFGHKQLFWSQRAYK